MISGIVYVFLGFVVHDWSGAVELHNTLYLCVVTPPVQVRTVHV